MANRTAPLLTAAAVLAAAVTTVMWFSPAAQAAGLSPFDVAGRGATVPFTEIEAEKAANTYWESTNNAFPQSITVDLGQNRPVARLVLKLPPATAWATRTETLSVLGSTDGSAYSTVKGSAGYVFNPASGNTVTIPVATTQRYLRLTFTQNTGWPAGQLSEFEVYASSRPRRAAPTEVARRSS